MAMTESEIRRQVALVKREAKALDLFLSDKDVMRIVKPNWSHMSKITSEVKRLGRPKKIKTKDRQFTETSTILSSLGIAKQDQTRR
jgi:hypothetical protein